MQSFIRKSYYYIINKLKERVILSREYINSIKFTNMLQYTVIATDDEHYKLSAIIKNGKYVMPSLECTVDGVSLWCWDNDDYLINTLFPILKGESGFKEIEDDIPIEDLKDILNLFEEAIKMQFFNCA